jgi:hypothetical protein
MRQTAYGQKIGNVFALLIYCAFTAAILLVLMLGAQIYQGMVERNTINADQRTAISYIEAKLRHSDTLGDVYTGSFQGYVEFPYISTLYLEENYGDLTYHTMIYCYDGWLRELYCEKGLEFLPEDGMKVLPVQRLDYQEDADSGLIKITCVDNQGITFELNILLRSSGGIEL